MSDVETARRACCANCYTRLDLMIGDPLELHYCGECGRLLASIEATLETLRLRRDAALRDPLAESLPISWPPTVELVAREVADAIAAGHGTTPRRGTEWIASQYPELVWLSCLGGEALAFYQQTRKGLERFYPAVPQIVWEVLLRE